MDKKEEELIRFASSQYVDTFKEKFATLDENDKVKLMKKLRFFSSLADFGDYNDFIIKKLIEEPFYNILLNKILITSENSNSLTNSLVTFFEAIYDLYCQIACIISDNYDTPTGPIDLDWAYGELVPELMMEKGNFNLYHHGRCYASVIKKLSRSLNDGGSLVQTAIYRALNSYSLLEHSHRTIESLDRKTVINVFQENFERVKDYSDMSDVFGGLLSLISKNLIENFQLKDLLFVFLNKKDAKAIRPLFKLKHDLTFGVYNPSKRVSFSKQNVLINFDREVIGLQLEYLDLKEIPRSVLKLENLRILNLFYTNLHKLPSKLGKLSRLEELNLCNYRDNLRNNTVQNLPKSLKGLKRLKILNLSTNLIREIKNLSKLNNLQELYLYECQITKIEGMEKLSNLKKLDLSNNQILKIKGLENLANLKELYLRNCKITEISGLENLTNLEILDLQNNQITKIEGMENLSNLKRLDLLNNPVFEESETLKGLKTT